MSESEVRKRPDVALPSMIGLFVLLWVSPTGRELTGQSMAYYWQVMSRGAAAWVIPLAIGMLLLIIQLDNALRARCSGWLEWSMVNATGNSAMRPIAGRWLGPIYAMWLLACLPLLVWFEEFLFRYTANHWLVWWLLPAGMPDVWRGVAVGVLMMMWAGPVFGLLHLTAGVPVRMAICWSLSGWVLMIVYLQSNIWSAVAVHVTFDVAVVCWIFYELHIKSAVPKQLEEV